MTQAGRGARRWRRLGAARSREAQAGRAVVTRRPARRRGECAGADGGGAAVGAAGRPSANHDPAGRGAADLQQRAGQVHGGAVPETGGAVPADPAGGGGEAAAAGRGAAADRAAGPRQREPGLQDRLPQRVRPDHRGDGGRLPQDPGELADPAQRPQEGDREPEQGHHGHGAEGRRGQGQLTGGAAPSSP